jgi:hypothetical protein
MHPPTMAATVVIRPPETTTRPHYRCGRVQQSADIQCERLLSLKLEKISLLLIIS